MELILVTILAILTGLAAGYVVGMKKGHVEREEIERKVKEEAKLDAERIIQKAHEEASELKAKAEKLLQEAREKFEEMKRQALLQAKEEVLKEKERLEEEIREKRRELSELEKRLLRREEFLDKRESSLDKREENLDKRAEFLEKLEAELEEKKTELENIKKTIHESVKKEFEAEFQKWKQEEEEKIRNDAIQRSCSTILGKVGEQLAPLLLFENYGINLKDIRFLGSPVDFIVFKGLYDGNPEEIIFVEVKSGNSTNLTPRERMVKKLIEEKKVSWKTFHTKTEINKILTNNNI